MQIDAKPLKRLHSLDSLRAIMMLLGIVFHSSLYYSTIDYGVAAQDPHSKSIIMDLIVIFVHSFRMPIFFFIAGFFAAFLLYSRGSKEMLKNRILRVFLPFVVFILILNPLVNFSAIFVKLAFVQDPSPFLNAFAQFDVKTQILPYSTQHLWFLYYLTIFSLIIFGLHFVFGKYTNFLNKMSSVFEWIFIKPIFRILFFSSIMMLIYVFIGSSELETSFSFVPDINTIVFYFYFYGIGFLLFRSKHLIESINKYNFSLIILASLFIFLKIGLILGLNLGTSSNVWYLVVLNSFIVWMFLFGITGAFIKYLNSNSRKMRYISDASYWIYLIHSPFVDFFPAFWVNLPLIAELKFLLNISLTFAICLISYKYLVRKTFIGAFLNGKKYID